jgi:serine/threonine protein kinase
MELDELEEHDENQMKIGAKPEKKKKDDWKQNFSDINSMKEYIKTNGHKDLQKFTIIDYIGKGSESLVYKVKVNNTNNVFALKVIKKHKNKINLSELILCKKLKHKNLINTLCYYADPNKQFDYMIMEIGNSNLMDFARKILKRLTLSESFLCMVAFQALQGLAYLHRLNIVHLDIKPQNLIINDFLDIKIIDYSVSIDYSKYTKDIKMPYVGTPYYMAPEIINSEKVKRNDMQKIDLFSLGVTLYVLAFGDYPFEMSSGDSDEEIYKKIKSGWKVEDKNNEFSEHFIKFLNGLLEGDINKRMNIDEALNSYFIRGAQILMNEKENTYNANSFLSYLITDHFRSFNEYLSSRL